MRKWRHLPTDADRLAASIRQTAESVSRLRRYRRHGLLPASAAFLCLPADHCAVVSGLPAGPSSHEVVNAFAWPDADRHRGGAGSDRIDGLRQG